jgi:acyl transferase domain-containing protein
VQSSVAALKLVQAIAQTEWAERPRLWFITQGAQAVADDSSLALAQTPLWGLGRVVAEEHPEFWGGLIDLEATAVPDHNAPSWPTSSSFQRARTSLPSATKNSLWLVLRGWLRLVAPRPRLPGNPTPVTW